LNRVGRDVVACFDKMNSGIQQAGQHGRRPQSAVTVDCCEHCTAKERFFNQGDHESADQRAYGRNEQVRPGENPIGFDKANVQWTSIITNSGMMTIPASNPTSMSRKKPRRGSP
jgi:hypothetical protein